MAVEKTIEYNYIYLLQEREFVRSGENIYKVGRSTQQNTQRVRQYPKGSKLILMSECDDCVGCEKQIISMFTKKFKHRRDIGSEYFEGQKDDMIRCINLIIFGANQCADVCSTGALDKSDSSDNSITYRERVIEEVSEIFPNCAEDESFGGHKKFIIIEKSSDKTLIVRYIRPIRSDDFLCGDIDSICLEDFIDEMEINEFVADRMRYIRKILGDGTICEDTPYDINSPTLVSKLDKTKKHATVVGAQAIYLHGGSFDIDHAYSEKHGMRCTWCIQAKISNLLMCNLKINGNMYATIFYRNEPDDIINGGKDMFKHFDNIKDFYELLIDIGDKEYKTETIIKICGIFYAQSWLRRHIPYLIRWTDRNEYYIINRAYEYIGLNTKQIDCKIAGEEYVSSGYGMDLVTFRKICAKYKEIVQKHKLVACLNHNDDTSRLMNLVV